MPREITAKWTTDPPYHPDDQENCFLNEEFLHRVWSELDLNDDSLPVMEVITEHERIHRTYVLGGLSRADRDNQVDQLYEEYRDRYQRWPHQETEYDLFYHSLNQGNWR